MSFSQSFRLAIKSLMTSKMRALLTMLGIIIGVAAVIIITSLGNGMEVMMSQQFERLGANLIQVQIMDSGASTRSVAPEDMKALVEKYPQYLSGFTPYVSVQGVVRQGGDEFERTSVYGVGHDFINERGETISGGQSVEKGRFLTYVDVEYAQNVCVIGTYLEKNAFQGNALGETITVKGVPFQVVGVLSESADSAEGSSDDQIYLPYTYALRLNGASRANLYLFTSSTKDLSAIGKALIENRLYQIFQDDPYFVMTSAEMMEVMDTMLNTLMIVLVAIAAISLLVGGIGIMNIMLVSVTERTREIGIRKSLGAKGRDIRGQFIIEAGTTSAIGGILGIILGVALAATPVPSREDAAQVLAALDIMVGDQNGNLNLSNTITRAEFTKLSVAATPAGDTVGDAVSVSPYPDVLRGSWSAPWIKAAVDQGLVKGNLQGYFEPDRTITLAEGVTIALRLLGYQDSDFTGGWPAGQMAQYRALELDQGVTCGQNQAMKRQDAMYLFYNLLTARSKTTGSYYIDALEPGVVSADGSIDRVALINATMEGPVVAEGNWQSQIPFDVSAAKVYRGGSASSLSAIQELDVVYWSKSMRTLWAYSDRITGTYEKAEPSASAPMSVTVAGRTYSIESSAAAFDLSDLGSYKVGNTVTLLLGREGDVAAVREAQAGDAVLYGVVKNSSVGTYEDEKGDSYTSNTITILATDGNEYTYQVSTKSLKAGAVVRVTAGADGVTVRRVTTTALSGKVNATSTRIGDRYLAEDAEILDVYEDTGAVKLYPSRLAGMELTEKMVKFYATNADGVITHLILNDATGDCHSYGILTGVNEVDTSMAVMGSYTFDLLGSEMTWVSQNSIYHLTPGPCQIKGLVASGMGVGDLDRIISLESVRLEMVKGGTGVSRDNRSYTISDSVAVYEARDNEYYYSSLERIDGGDYSLTGYYDKLESKGGRIRVILAR